MTFTFIKEIILPVRNVMAIMSNIKLIADFVNIEMLVKYLRLRMAKSPVIPNVTGYRNQGTKPDSATREYL
jgi:hypothetical protein